MVNAVNKFFFNRYIVVKKNFLSSFKAAKLELMTENLRWRGTAKVQMHVAVCFACMYAVAILAHKIGRPELANSIAAFTH